MNRLYFVSGRGSVSGLKPDPSCAAARHAPAALGTLSWPESDRLELRPRSVYLVPKDVTLAFRFEPGCELAAFHFRLELVPGFDLFDGVREVREYTHLVPTIDRMMELCEGSEGLAESGRILAAVLETACELTPYTRADIHAVIARREKHRALFDFLSERNHAGVTIARVAEHLGKHRDTVSRQFRRDFGVPLKTYMTRLLVQRAVDEILSTERRMYEIAAELGFSSEYYFSRFVKKHTGSSPLDLRRSLSI
jgi:AraC-like DNA-binding protein